MSDYTPVDCALQDKLEAIATLHRTADITYQTDSGETASAKSQVVDIYADSGADYCKLENGTVIRLDKLQTIEAGGEKVW